MATEKCYKTRRFVDISCLDQKWNGKLWFRYQNMALSWLFCRHFQTRLNNFINFQNGGSFWRLLLGTPSGHSFWSISSAVIGRGRDLFWPPVPPTPPTPPQDLTEVRFRGGPFKKRFLTSKQLAARSWLLRSWDPGILRSWDPRILRSWDPAASS